FGFSFFFGINRLNASHVPSGRRTRNALTDRGLCACNHVSAALVKSNASKNRTVFTGASFILTFGNAPFALHVRHLLRRCQGEELPLGHRHCDERFRVGTQIKLECLAFIVEASLYFLLHITPVVQGHLRGTGARSTSRIDQQANSLDWRWPSRTL